MLLVHGAAHDSSCWSELEHELRPRGIEIATVDLPSAALPTPAGAMREDAEAILEATRSFHPAIVVCHSYGGVPTTHALDSTEGVQRIVYLAAFAPDAGESLTTISPAGYEPDDAEDGWAASEDGVTISAIDPIPLFYHLCDPAVAAEAAARVRPQSLASFAEPIGEPAWRSIPSSYIATTYDRAIPVALQRAMATRCEELFELPADHSPFLSLPRETAELLVHICTR